MGSPMPCKQISTQYVQHDFQSVGMNKKTSRVAWRQNKDKVVFVMGATGTGKSRLSVDLAKRFFSPAEIVNSDKMQVYRGLDIVTNKITEEEQRGVKHHLLGFVDPDDANFTAADFCNRAQESVQGILDDGKLPIIVGGSNSYIEALVDGKDYISRYDCCFLWVDVSMPVLHQFVSERVDTMVHNGMVDEVRRIFDPTRVDYHSGIRKAIGVPEFDKYFRSSCSSSSDDDRERMLREAIDEIKENTCKLACRQREKIRQLKNNYKKWNIHRLDATEVFRKRGREAEQAWEDLVNLRTAMIVREFLSPPEPAAAAAAATPSIKINCGVPQLPQLAAAAASY